MLPVTVPGIAMKRATERRHPVGTADTPTRTRLLHPTPDHLLARSLHHPAADRLTLLQTLRIPQVGRPTLEVTRHLRQSLSLATPADSRSGGRQVHPQTDHPRPQQLSTPFVQPCLGLGRSLTAEYLGTSRQMLPGVVNVQKPPRAGQLRRRLVPDPRGPVTQDRNAAGILQAQPAGPAADTRPEVLRCFDTSEQHTGMRHRQPPTVPRRRRGRLTPLAAGEDTQTHL